MSVSLREKFPEVFRTTPGVVRNFEAKIARSMPFATKEAVGEELRKLESQGILKKLKLYGSVDLDLGLDPDPDRDQILVHHLTRVLNPSRLSNQQLHRLELLDLLEHPFFLHLLRPLGLHKLFRLPAVHIWILGPLVASAPQSVPATLPGAPGLRGPLPYPDYGDYGGYGGMNRHMGPLSSINLGPGFVIPSIAAGLTGLGGNGYQGVGGVPGGAGGGGYSYNDYYDDTSAAPGPPGNVGSSGIPGTHGVPGSGGLAAVPGMNVPPGLSDTPGVPVLPGASGVPAVGGAPPASAVPTGPGASDVPDVSGTPDATGAPGSPSALDDLGDH
ncbi:hypothetical protein HPB50_028553 [Hyalomma asiaticum]|nr:hypothetical protein HPB50_028553 [Hyalomma asiaticum]